ncbi:MAG: HNH endonuclease [Alphaproteobacteria bacterium]|jgi:putative restriction endonuclease
MKFWVGVTDNKWFNYLAARQFDEVNFWQPSAKPLFKDGGERFGMPFLFKLKKPYHHVAGGGFFVKNIKLPLALAWEFFGERNGASSLDELLELLAPHSGTRSLTQEIGCTILANSFFLPPQKWLPDPPGWANSIVRGKGYNSDEPDGAVIWTAVQSNFPTQQPSADNSDFSKFAVRERFGEPVLVAPRLGQASFRALVTEAYDKRCAITGENTLAVLEAAHIVPFGKQGTHEVRNGLLLRADFHRLFDVGLVSVSPELRVKVSPKIRESWFNGKVYYRLNDQPLSVLPHRMADQPNREFLDWHMRNCFQN